MSRSGTETWTPARAESIATERRSRLVRARLVALVLAAASGLALLASACGGSSPSGVARVGTTTSSDAPSAHDQALAFARCMRRHGVNVPDNLADTPATPWGDAPGVHAALQACRQLLPPGHTSRTPSAEELKELLAYAVCMRRHHVEISDPNPATGDMQLPGYTTRARQQTDPVFKAAHTACKDKLPGGRWVPWQASKHR